MDRIRKLSTSIDMLCNGAETDEEYYDGVNILLGCLGVCDEDSEKIRDRLNIQNSLVEIEEKKRGSFIKNLTKKPIQYSRMTDKEVRKLVKTTTDNIRMEKIMINVLNELMAGGRSKNVAFSSYDKSHFLCMCLEKLGVGMNESLSSVILDIN